VKSLEGSKLEELEGVEIVTATFENFSDQEIRDLVVDYLQEAF